jgi:hypothetical protein
LASTYIAGCVTRLVTVGRILENFGDLLTENEGDGHHDNQGSGG